MNEDVKNLMDLERRHNEAQIKLGAVCAEIAGLADRMMDMKRRLEDASQTVLIATATVMHAAEKAFQIRYNKESMIEHKGDD